MKDVQRLLERERARRQSKNVQARIPNGLYVRLSTFLKENHISWQDLIYDLLTDFSHQITEWEAKRPRRRKR